MFPANKKWVFKSVIVSILGYCKIKKAILWYSDLFCGNDVFMLICDVFMCDYIYIHIYIFVYLYISTTSTTWKLFYFSCHITYNWNSVVTRWYFKFSRQHRNNACRALRLVYSLYSYSNLPNRQTGVFICFWRKLSTVQAYQEQFRLIFEILKKEIYSLISSTENSKLSNTF